MNDFKKWIIENGKGIGVKTLTEKILMLEAWRAATEEREKKIGKCDTCCFAMSSGRGEDYRDCKKGNGIHKKGWYCADFQSGYCDDCVHSEAMDDRLWCNAHKKAVDWDYVCYDFEGVQ